MASFSLDDTNAWVNKRSRPFNIVISGKFTITQADLDNRGGSIDIISSLWETSYQRGELVITHETITAPVVDKPFFYDVNTNALDRWGSNLLEEWGIFFKGIGFNTAGIIFYSADQGSSNPRVKVFTTGGTKPTNPFLATDPTASLTESNFYSEYSFINLIGKYNLDQNYLDNNGYTKAEFYLSGTLNHESDGSGGTAFNTQSSDVETAPSVKIDTDFDLNFDISTALIDGKESTINLNLLFTKSDDTTEFLQLATVTKANQVRNPIFTFTELSAYTGGTKIKAAGSYDLTQSWINREFANEDSLSGALSQLHFDLNGFIDIDNANTNYATITEIDILNKIGLNQSFDSVFTQNDAVFSGKCSAGAVVRLRGTPSLFVHNEGPFNLQEFTLLPSPTITISNGEAFIGLREIKGDIAITNLITELLTESTRPDIAINLAIAYNSDQNENVIVPIDTEFVANIQNFITNNAISITPSIIAYDSNDDSISHKTIATGSALILTPKVLPAPTLSEKIVSVDYPNHTFTTTVNYANVNYGTLAAGESFQLAISGKVATQLHSDGSLEDLVYAKSVQLSESQHGSSGTLSLTIDIDEGDTHNIYIGKLTAQASLIKQGIAQTVLARSTEISIDVSNPQIPSITFSSPTKDQVIDKDGSKVRILAKSAGNTITYQEIIDGKPSNDLTDLVLNNRAVGSYTYQATAFSSATKLWAFEQISFRVAQIGITITELDGKREYMDFHRTIGTDIPSTVSGNAAVKTITLQPYAYLRGVFEPNIEIKASDGTNDLPITLVDTDNNNQVINSISDIKDLSAGLHVIRATATISGITKGSAFAVHIINPTPNTDFHTFMEVLDQVDLPTCVNENNANDKCNLWTPDKPLKVNYGFWSPALISSGLAYFYFNIRLIGIAGSHELDNSNPLPTALPLSIFTVPNTPHSRAPPGAYDSQFGSGTFSIPPSGTASLKQGDYNIQFDLLENYVNDEIERESRFLYQDVTLGKLVLNREIEDITPPVLTIISPKPNEKFALDGSAIRFSATAIDNVDGDISNKINWTDVTDPNNPSILTSAILNAIEDNYQVGKYTFRLFVSDAALNQSTADISFEITPPPDLDPPVITITSPTQNQNIIRNEPFDLTATAFDTIDGKVNVTWHDVTGGANTLLDHTVKQRIRTLGNYTYEVRASDAAGNIAKKQVKFSIVRETDRRAPTILINKPTSQNYEIFTRIDLEAEAHDDRDGNISNLIIWTDITDSENPKNIATKSVFLDTLGSRTYQASVTDQAGNTSHDQVTFNVIDTTPPVVNISKPADNMILNVGDSLTLEAAARDQADGDLTNITYTANDIPIISGVILEPGIYLIKASAVDKSGNIGSANVTITVRWEFENPIQRLLFIRHLAQLDHGLTDLEIIPQMESWTLTAESLYGNTIKRNNPKWQNVIITADIMTAAQLRAANTTEDLKPVAIRTLRAINFDFLRASQGQADIQRNTQVDIIRGNDNRGTF